MLFSRSSFAVAVIDYVKNSLLFVGGQRHRPEIHTLERPPDSIIALCQCNRPCFDIAFASCDIESLT
jgi:hypothetical protein